MSCEFCVGVNAFLGLIVLCYLFYDFNINKLVSQVDDYNTARNSQKTYDCIRCILMMTNILCSIIYDFMGLHYFGRVIHFWSAMKNQFSIYRCIIQ